MKIELPEEVVKFMQGLANEIKSQDNRATRQPYFYVVQSKEEIPAPVGYGDGDEKYYCSKYEEAHTKDEWIKTLKERDEENETHTDVDTFIDEECTAFGTHLITVEDNIFLTEKGYNQHMELNGHNYRHFKETYSYVKYAGRNPEMENLLKAIMSFNEAKEIA